MNLKKSWLYVASVCRDMNVKDCDYFAQNVVSGLITNLSVDIQKKPECISLEQIN